MKLGYEPRSQAYPAFNRISHFELSLWMLETDVRVVIRPYYGMDAS